jgi:2OG-Fe(II) oxygenase superfamily
MKVMELTCALTVDAVKGLVRKEIGVARIRHFFPSKCCDGIATSLLTSPLYGKYTNAPQIGRIGRAFFETTVSNQALMDYFGRSRELLRMLRDACDPHQNPIDKLRLELDECWDSGAHLARLGGKTMYAGLIRVFDQGACAEPHQDHLDWDAAIHEIYEDAYYPVQLAANVYLHMPSSGGDLAIWPVSLSRTEYEARRIAGSYGVDVTGLGDPVVITPEKGELVVFNARQIHRVSAPQMGNRVSASCFIGYRTVGQPLSIWS